MPRLVNNKPSRRLTGVQYFIANKAVAIVRAVVFYIGSSELP